MDAVPALPVESAGVGELGDQRHRNGDDQDERAVHVSGRGRLGPRLFESWSSVPRVVPGTEAVLGGTRSYERDQGEEAFRVDVSANSMSIGEQAGSKRTEAVVGSQEAVKSRHQGDTGWMRKPVTLPSRSNRVQIIASPASKCTTTSTTVLSPAGTGNTWPIVWYLPNMPIR